MLNLDGFANPWEHSRLLSDSTRNAAMVSLLARHAPGHRVLEVGCGSGLLSCIAARMGASKVYAIEPTAVIEVASQLVTQNGLEDTVELIEGRIQDIVPKEVDFAFSELLNADPFLENVVEVTNATRPWVREEGVLSPRRIRVYAALTRASNCAREVTLAHRELDAFSKAYDLNLSGLTRSLGTDESYRFLGHQQHPVSAPVLAFDLPLGTGEIPKEEVLVETKVDSPGPIDGAIVWFECELDDGIILHNRPGTENHWGQLICGWSKEYGAKENQSFRLNITLDDNEIDVQLMP